MAAAADSRAPRRRRAHRVRRGRGRRDGAVQARAGAVGTRHDARAATDARARGRARRRRADSRRGPGEARRRPPAVPSARRGPGDHHHRDDDGRHVADHAAGVTQGDRRAHHRGRCGIPARLSAVERAHSVPRRGAGQIAGRVAGLDSLRQRGDRGHVAAGGSDRVAMDRPAKRTVMSRATVLALMLAVAWAGPADPQLADPHTAPATRVASGGKILDAIWRYYNLVDFAVSQRDPKAATAVRLAFEEAESYVKAPAPAPERMRPPLTRIARVLTGVIEASSPSARR